MLGPKVELIVLMYLYDNVAVTSLASVLLLLEEVVLLLLDEDKVHA